MKIGTGPAVLPVQGEDRVRGFQRTVEQTRFLRDQGFDFLFVGHHYFALPGDLMHPVPLVARLAADAAPMTLAFLYLFPFASPIDLAEEIQTLDVICGGKLIVTAAQGWKDAEFKGFGIERRERASRLVETLEVMRSLWTKDRTSFQGKHFTLKETPRVGHPVQRPHPKVWVAANGDPGVRRAATMADGWAISATLTLSTIRRQLEQVYWPAVRAAGKPGEACIFRGVYIAETADAAMRAARPALEATRKRMTASVQDPNAPVEERKDLPLDQLAQERFLIGDPQGIVDQLRRYQQMGIGYANLSFPPHGDRPTQASVNESVRLFAREVMPHARDA